MAASVAAWLLMQHLHRADAERKAAAAARAADPAPRYLAALAGQQASMATDRSAFVKATQQIFGYRTWIRPEGYRRALLKLLRPFPSGQFQIRDVQTNYSVDYAGLRIAVCWVLVGDYDGQADFGPLTGQRTDLLGVSQFLVQNGKIMRETRIYDEIALRAQINAGRGDGDEPVPFANIY